MLGHKLVQRFTNKFEVYTTVRGALADYSRFGLFDRVNVVENLDIGNFEDVEKLFENVKPNIVVNCIGIIKQIPDSKSIIKTIEINSLLPHKLAEIATRFGSKLITISTDCVFDGKKGMYTEADNPNATDLYGKSKNLGEVTEGNHLTLRTSIIGRELCTSYSLVEWFLSNEEEQVKGFSNAIYSGFPTVVFADILSELIVNHKGLSGLFHLSSEPINKYELLILVKKYFRVEMKIDKFDDFKIDRSLDSTKFRAVTGFKPKTWDEMIELMANDSAQYSNWR